MLTWFAWLAYTATCKHVSTVQDERKFRDWKVRFADQMSTKNMVKTKIWKVHSDGTSVDTAAALDGNDGSNLSLLKTTTLD